jgi:GNAT superfamily N-acetyltransferase
MITSSVRQAVRIRPIEAGDRDALGDFYRRLSPESRAARFHGAGRGLDGGETHYFCGPDHAGREGLVAVIEEPAGPTIVGHLCLEPVSPGAVEMAVAVADAWQGHGVGRALLQAAIDWAGRNGIERLQASMRWGNAAILGLIRSTGLPATFGPPDGGTMEVELDLAAALPRAA